MKLVNKLLSEANQLKIGTVTEKCVGDGMRIATYELKTLLEQIHNELSNTIEENKKFIIDRAKTLLDKEELSDMEMEELFGLECTGDVFICYDNINSDNHSFDLGQYVLAKRLIKLLE